MAIVKFKQMQRMSGVIDGLVFRTVGEVIIVSKAPSFRKERQSELQKRNRERFREVSAKVRKKLRDPQVKAHYLREAERLKLPNAYTAAIKEGMSAKER